MKYSLGYRNNETKQNRVDTKRFEAVAGEISGDNFLCLLSSELNSAVIETNLYVVLKPVKEMSENS